MVVTVVVVNPVDLLSVAVTLHHPLGPFPPHPGAPPHPAVFQPAVPSQPLVPPQPNGPQLEQSWELEEQLEYAEHKEDCMLEIVANWVLEQAVETQEATEAVSEQWLAHAVV